MAKRAARTLHLAYSTHHEPTSCAVYNPHTMHQAQI